MRTHNDSVTIKVPIVTESLWDRAHGGAARTIPASHKDLARTCGVDAKEQASPLLVLEGQTSRWHRVGLGGG